MQKLPRRAELKEKWERIPWEQKFKRQYLWIALLHWFGFGIYYASHYPLTSDHSNLNVLVRCERYSTRNISRKICLQVGHGLWQFPPLATVGSCSSLDMWVILMSSSLWTVEIRIIDYDKKLVIEEQYIVNYQVRFGFVLI